MKESFLSDGFFTRLEALSFNLKSNLAGYFGGKHLVTTYGQTVEFADYREYQLGDDIRRIDWNLFSRFEKYFLKLFTDERQMQIQLFLDYSGSMHMNYDGKGLFAITAAVAIGYLAVHNMDKVTFNIMKGNRSDNPFGTIVGKTNFFRAVKTLGEVGFAGETDIEACITNCPDTGTNSGLSVIISDFFTDSNWKKAVDYLCYKKRQVLLIQVLSPNEIDPLYDGHISLIDAESEDVSDYKNLKLRINRSRQLAYEEALKDFRQDIKDFCNKRGAGFISVRSDAQIEKVLFGELFKAGIMS